MLPPPARLRACALVLPTPPQGGSDARESRFSSPRLHNGWCAMTADCMEQRFPLPSHNPIIEVLPERCRSGRTDPTGNRVYGYRRTVGSNPTLSAKRQSVIGMHGPAKPCRRPPAEKPCRKDMPCARRHAEITSRHEGFPHPSWSCAVPRPSHSAVPSGIARGRWAMLRRLALPTLPVRRP